MRKQIWKIRGVILSIAIVLGLFQPSIGKAAVTESANGTVYYFSSTEGDDSNDGLSPGKPFQSLEKAEELTLEAGDSLLFKRGDIWYGTATLNLRDGNKEQPIIISAYGDENEERPSFRFYEDTVIEKQAENVLILRNANGVEISDLQIGSSNSGIYFEYDTLNNQYVRVTNCHFHDIYGVTQADTELYSKMPFSSAMYWRYTGAEEYIGTGQYPVRDVYIDNCTAYDAGSLTGYNSIVKNLYMTKCVAENNGYYGTVITAKGGYIDQCVFTNNGTRPMPVGSTGIMVSAENFTIKNSVISNQQRQGDNPDGCGIDFEWRNRNVTIDNCLIESNAGVGIMFFTSGNSGNLGTNRGTNYGCVVKNCKFVNNNMNVGNIGYYDIYAVNGGCAGCTIKNNQYVIDSTTGCETIDFTKFIGTNDFTLVNNVQVGAISENYNPLNPDIKNVYSFEDDYQTETAVTGLWNYYVREVVTNTFTPLEYNSETGRWEAPTGMGSAYIWKGAMYPSATVTAEMDYQTVLQFVAPKSGTVTVSFPDGITVDGSSTDGVRLSFWANNTVNQLFNNVTYDSGRTEIQSYIIEVVEGQQLNFLLHRNISNAGDTISINPTITYWVDEIDGNGEDEHSDNVYSFIDDYQTETAVAGLWNYYVREVATNTFTPLEYNSETGRWEAPAGMGSAYIWEGAMYPSGTATATADYETVLQFVAPYNGSITVSFPSGIKVASDSNDGVKLSFWANGTSDQKFTNVLYQAGTSEIQVYTLSVVEGQILNFLLHRNGNTAGDTTQINPTVIYATGEITEDPTEEPTEDPAEEPTEEPTEDPAEDPTEEPAENPTERPTEESTEGPTEEPTEGATEENVNSSGNTTQNSPKTGDDFSGSIFVVVAIITLTMMIYLGYRKKKSGAAD